MKVPISVAQKDGKQPTHVAAQFGATGCLHWLLEKGADPNAQDAIGHTASHYACENNHAEVKKNKLIWCGLKKVTKDLLRLF